MLMIWKILFITSRHSEQLDDLEDLLVSRRTPDKIRKWFAVAHDGRAKTSLNNLHKEKSKQADTQQICSFSMILVCL